MISNAKKLSANLAATTAAAAMLLAGATSASASMLTYKGVTFETLGDGSATVSNGDLVLNPTGDSFSVHTNRIPDNGNDPSFINANDTPFIRFSYEDTGVQANKIDGLVQDEAATGSPRVLAGSLFSKTKAASATYGDDSERDANEKYTFFEGDRASVSHDVLLGRTVDGTLYTTFDGVQRSSDIFKDAGIDFDFNDLFLRARDASGKTIRFTDLAFGDDFSPEVQAVPAPGNLLLMGLGLGLVALVRRRRRAG